MKKRTMIGTGIVIAGLVTLVSHFNDEAPAPKAPQPKAPEPEPATIMDARLLPSGPYIINRNGAGLFEWDRTDDSVGRRFASLAIGSCVDPHTVPNNQDAQYGFALSDVQAESLPGVVTGYIDMTSIDRAPDKMKGECKAKFTEPMP